MFKKINEAKTDRNPSPEHIYLKLEREKKVNMDGGEIKDHNTHTKKDPLQYMSTMIQTFKFNCKCERTQTGLNYSMYT